MPSDPGPLRIRNQRYPRWYAIAEHVLVGGILVTFLVIELVGLWLFGFRTTMYVLLACLLAILPVVIHGWLLIWDLSRPGPGHGVTARDLFDAVARGIRRKGLGAAVEWTVLTAVRPWLPAVHAVSQLKLGEEAEVFPPIRFPAGAVRSVRFAADPGQDFNDVEPQTPLYEATIEIHSGRQFRLTLDEADAQRLRQWAVARGITVCDCDGYRPRPVQPASGA